MTSIGVPGVTGMTRPTILATLDGSHFSESILGTVITMARQMGAAVELLRVGRPSTLHETPAHRRVDEMTAVGTQTGTRLAVPLPGELHARRVETREQALDRLEAELRDYLCDRAQEMAAIPTTVTVTLDDDPAHAIVEHARRMAPTLIAMATHGRTGVGHLLAGSVCEAVIRSGVAPVLVLRP